MRLVLDVESNGLDGKAFAVGWVVTDHGKVVHEEFLRCPINGTVDPWVLENVIPHLPPINCESPEDLRLRFWQSWIALKEAGVTVWADCGFPVETNFLSACVKDDPEVRKWQSPYPLHEIATVFEMKGLDPTAKYDRLADEIAHHPTGDAKQSARLLNKYFPEY